MSDAQPQARTPAPAAEQAPAPAPDSSPIGSGWITSTDIALTALVLGSGITDVTAFLTLDNVFTSAMTGNTALLGIALSGGHWTAAAHAFSALVGFTFGAVIGALMYREYHPRRPGRLAHIAPLLFIELVCLGLFAALLTFVARPHESLVVYALILLSAIGMGLQGVAARQINSPGINTIVFTSTLISIVISLTSALLVREDAAQTLGANTKRQIAMFSAYGLGALAAGLLARSFLPIIAWIPMVAVLTALGCCAIAARTERHATSA